MTRRPLLRTGIVAVAAAMLASLTTSAQAADDLPSFYQAPDSLPAGDGTVIRTEAIRYLLDPAGVSDVAYTSKRMLYTSRDRTGERHAISGSVIVPKAAWKGPGTRPVIGYAVGTQGVGDTCAPSRQFSEGIEYEGLFMAGLLKRGYALAVTDYEGLGTAGAHTYMDRVSQGQAVLDAVRAAQRQDWTGLSASSPVGIYGYSQGGGAAASAAELAGSYAPELKVKGTVAGAVPADLSVLPGVLDGSLYAEFLWFAVSGLTDSYDIDLNPYLNARGQQFLADASNDCVFDLFNASFKQSKDFTVDGSTLGDLIAREPFRTMIDDQRIGRIKPSAPVLLTHSVLDDVIPYRTGRQLAVDWCARGANVRLSTNASPLHVGGILNNATEVYGFLEARLAGKPAPSSCWRL
ncbi:lipase family protein [Aeromicrobium massiliense]|uniref:lipase family protein n=1 Tax=Aeromicrobium massiliense TaxID=1464554 RepID=UPI0002DB5A39|nr:lipase family protein [Aeromicrobium massiliense]